MKEYEAFGDAEKALSSPSSTPSTRPLEDAPPQVTPSATAAVGSSSKAVSGTAAAPAPRFTSLTGWISHASRHEPPRITITDQEWERRCVWRIYVLCMVITENPRNWTQSRRVKNTVIISLTGFLTTLASSILVASSSILREQFGKSREVVTLTTSIYVAGLGCGPFLFAPISELYGRQIAYSSSMILFTILNLVLCFAPSFSSILVLRLLTGIFGSSGPSLGVATLSDLFAPKERGKPLSYYALGPMAGPTLGGVMGSYLALVDASPMFPELWRWCFRLLAILVGLNTLAIIFLMDETYAPVLRKTLEEEDGVAISRPARLRQLFRPKPEAKAIMIRTFTRPPRMLVNPACGLFVVYYAYVYSIIYVFLVSLPLLYSRHNPPDALFTYNWKPTITGLSYLGLGCGFFSSAFTAASLQDRIYGYCSRRYKNDGQPEYRLCITQFGMIIFPIGLLIWGWTAQAQTHWMGPITGSFILAYGLMLCFNSIQNWIVDAFVSTAYYDKD
ncbi:BZ3500_MvSof-1268-A1-R1_Chr2-1g04234 [Microbotryum saponariae]|uniref:BZ3500_MvSof-1268-A1-R1_Chr2-1g04234 protein n=1 Tax=Microbotryum saponariae TaxID=289078 RepID=A0A2X0K7P0_9BASI|nr:BZ3500_MvSof-1268-A1-R1_Chr2-1g04234 [Microbotryum saponariae]SCZ91221.1 BZ3501_MvSof-1269-A2-R1_Chr2-1g03890 [Microbotryum saponariae]